MYLVLFDVDGTLVESGHRDSRCFADTFEEIYQLPFPGIDWTRFPHVTDDTIFRTAVRELLGRELRDSEMGAFQEIYLQKLNLARREAPGHFREVPGAVKLVNALQKQKEYLIGIATGGWEAPARIKLSHVGIQWKELVLRGGDNCPTREAILSAALEALQACHQAVKKAVYVGDALWDITTTRKMELNFVGLRWKGDLDVLYDAGAQVVLQNFEDQDQFFEALEAASPPKNF